MAAAMKFKIWCNGILFLIASFVYACNGENFSFDGTALSRDEDTSGHKVTLPGDLKFPFRGTLYKDLYVSKDGLVGFHAGTLHQTEIFTDTLTREDPAFIAPYYFPAQDIGSKIGQNQYDGQILYRIPGVDKNHISQQELANYSTIIQQSVIGINQFNATYGLVVTWLEVVSKTDVLKGCAYPCKNNTFQVVLVTDGHYSFAIFNYIAMNIANDRFTQSGFNAGEGRGYTTALNSNQLSQAHMSYGSEVKGRYIYRVDTEEIQEGGCSNDLSSGGVLSINPMYAGMFGGKMIDISGPCMRHNPQTSYVRCRFNGDDNFITFGQKINTVKARCNVPIMSVRGWVTVEMSIERRPFIYKTKILIVHPGRLAMMEKVQLVDNGPDNRWNETQANQLTLRWNKTQLVSPFDYTSVVNISLWGYREDLNGVVWQNLRSIGIGRIKASQESYTFPASSIACIGQMCNDFEVGIIKVELQDQNKATSHRYLTSHIAPLGFYVNNAMVMKFGNDWPEQKCMDWYNKDRQDMNWLTKLQSCPCNLVQALSDIGRWQPDFGCYLYDNSPNKCTFHHGAVHCVRSVQPSVDGAGNQCCYDAAGNLMYSADSFQGSTPDRSHTWGASPYGRVGLVPDMSHWVKDVVTFFYCCLWTDYKDCDYYMDQRPTRDCRGYNPPTPAMIYGQGHIQTFDGNHQRMCGEGDFMLMKTNVTTENRVTVQGRFFRNAFPNIVGERGNTSVMLTNVGVQVVGDTTENVEIRLKLPTSDRRKRYLDVLVNHRYYYFNNKESRWQDFKSFAVVNTDITGMGSNFTIILSNGIGIQIADCNMTLCVLIMAPPTLQGQVEGLLGNFNGNMTDDLLNLNYSTSLKLQNNQLTELQKYQMFKFPWAATRQTSVIPMVYLAKNEPPICTLSQPNRFLPSCQNNHECMFDYKATGDQNIAEKTKAMSLRFQAISDYVTPERSCGLLDVPRSIKNNYNYKLDQTVTVQGCRSGSLQGDDFTYTCVSTGDNTQSWSPSVTAVCSGTVEVADTAMIVGIIIGVLAFIVILIIVGVLIRKARQNKSNEYKDSRNPVSEGKTEYSAAYSRPHKVPQEDVEQKRSSQEDSL